MTYHEWTESEARREQAAEEQEQRHWDDPDYWAWYEKQRAKERASDG